MHNEHPKNKHNINSHSIGKKPMYAQPRPWPDEECKAIETMWKDGMSALQISMASNNRSRNAVIGKLHRMGLSDKDREQAPSKTMLMMHARLARRQTHMPKLSTFAKKPKAPRIPLGEEFAFARPWETRKFRECAFPREINGEVQSCCAPTLAVYCDHHKAVMFRYRTKRAA